ncbi:MAG: hypothetical protein JWL60_808, partial [Gemmatimonadetes bacterium]|nr:hypothetical protein [Gemmatimonadota bacterium]
MTRPGALLAGLVLLASGCSPAPADDAGVARGRGL